MTIRVGSLQELYLALSVAEAGQTILLEGGDYGSFSLVEGKGFTSLLSGSVTIASVDPDAPATFSSVSLSGVSGLTFEDIHFDFDTDGSPDFVIEDSHDIAIQDSVFYGDAIPDDANALPEVLGIELTGTTTGVTLSNTTISTSTGATTYVQSQSLLLDAAPSAPALPDGAILIGSIDELYEALAHAQPGATLALEGGDYGQLVLNSKSGFPINFPEGVTIISADPANPASFSDMGLNGVSNLTFDGIVFDYTYTPGDADNYQAFRVVNCAGVTIRNSVFDGDVAQGVSETADGVGYAYGLWIRAGSDITIENNEVFEFRRGIVSSYVDGLTISGNDLHSMGGDGMNFAQVQNVLIEGNYIHDFARNATASIHPDMIQFWTAGTTKPSTDIVIRDNQLDLGDGPWTQSIFMRNEMVDSGQAGAEMFYQNVLIENNVILNGHLHGINLGATDGAVIRSNTLLYQDGDTSDSGNGALTMPRIAVASNSQDVIIAQNIASSIIGWSSQAGWTVENNALIQTGDPTKPGYEDYFIASTLLPQDGMSNPVVLPGGEIAAMGAGATATLEGLDGQRLTYFHVYEDAENAAVRTYDATFAFEGGVVPAGTTFLWTFEDGTTATGPVVTRGYETGGHFNVTLTTTLPDGVFAALADHVAEQSLTHTFTVAIDGPEVLQQTDNGFVYYDYGTASTALNDAVVDGKLTLSATGVAASIGPAAVRDVGLARSFDIGMVLQATSNGYSAGEVLRIHQSLLVATTGTGELAVTLYLADGTTAKTITSGANLNDMGAHEIAIHQTDGLLELEVDGRIIGESLFDGEMNFANRALTFGNPWNKANFVGTVSGLEIQVNAEDFGGASWVSSDTPTDPVVVEPVIDPTPEPDPIVVSPEPDPVASPEPTPEPETTTTTTTESMVHRMIELQNHGSTLSLGGSGTQFTVAREELIDVMRADDSFELTFGLQGSANHGGEVFRLHGSFLASVTNSGDFRFEAQSEDGRWVTLQSTGGPLSDLAHHDIALVYENGLLSLAIDDRVVAETEFDGLDAMGGHAFTFGNPWGKTNFEGQISNIEITVPELEGVADSLGVSIAPEGVAATLARDSVDEILGADDFDISFSITSSKQDSVGEVFRIHQSIIASVTDDGDMKLQVWSEDGSQTQVLTNGVNLGDMQSHDVVLSYADGELDIIVDGVLCGGAALPAPLQSVGYQDLYFGNPWNKQNFESTLNDFTIVLPEDEGGTTHFVADAEDSSRLIADTVPVQDSILDADTGFFSVLEPEINV